MKTFSAFALMSLCGAVTLTASQAGEVAPSDVPSAQQIAQHICLDDGSRDEYPIEVEALEVVAQNEGLSVDEVCDLLIAELAAEEDDENALA